MMDRIIKQLTHLAEERVNLIQKIQLQNTVLADVVEMLEGALPDGTHHFDREQVIDMIDERMGNDA